MARLERELERGPLAHGWADQRWTLARVKTLIGRLFHVSYTVEGTWRLLKLRVPINHPSCSGDMWVLMQVSAKPVSSVDLQMHDLSWFGDRFR
ncbi:winged helix-turn-helix domain-containing protein [Streptomyces sp. NPDC001890]|uniref:helix-turn-helix domain-containing protein n=1 Tax=Streptomyces sp. NPDC001890 TaxID=3364620 RepID=UPI003682C2A5